MKLTDFVPDAYLFTLFLLSVVAVGALLLRGPRERACTACYGTGESQQQLLTPCPMCDGSGVLR